MHEAIFLIGFVVVQALSHILHDLFEKHACLQRLTKVHYLVIIFHPVVLHGIQDYGIHSVELVVKMIVPH